MHVPREAMLLRIFIGEDDKARHRPLYEYLSNPADRLPARRHERRKHAAVWTISASMSPRSARSAVDLCRPFPGDAARRMKRS
jgi:hypothetical protein